jgi:hypothetical protein
LSLAAAQFDTALADLGRIALFTVSVGCLLEVV